MKSVVMARIEDDSGARVGSRGSYRLVIPLIDPFPL